MVSLWESLDDDYKIHLKNICTADEFNASSLVERGQLRNQYLEECRMNKEQHTRHVQRNSEKKDPNGDDNDGGDDETRAENNEVKEEHNLYNRKKPPARLKQETKECSSEYRCATEIDDNDDKKSQDPASGDGVINLCDTDDDDDDDNVNTIIENNGVKQEYKKENEMNPAAIVTPSSLKKRKVISSGGHTEEEDDRRTNRQDRAVTSKETVQSSDNDEKSDTNEKRVEGVRGLKNDQGVVLLDLSLSSNNAEREQTERKTDFVDNHQGDVGSVDCSNAEDDRKHKSPTPEITPSSLLPPEVKREQAEEKLKVAKKKAYENYGDLILLHRFKGVGRLGGSHQCTFQKPGKNNKNVWDGDKFRPEYPVPNMATKKNANGDDEYDMEAFTSLAYNSLWQVNGPKFATQPTAGVDCVPNYMKEKGLSLPVFMKRSLTKKSDKKEKKSLGWEYVGNYRCISDKDLVLWESAENFSEASKCEIANKYLESAHSQRGDTYGRIKLDCWKNTLEQELEREPTEKESAKSLRIRAQELGFKSDISDKDLINLLVQLDEFHQQEIIEFVEYDERIYNYCIKGPTTKNGKGNIQAKDGGNVAKANDWYNFANEHMLM